MTFRTIAIADYERLVPFWKENYFVNELDDREHVKLFLDKNPNLSILVEDHGQIVGTVLGSFDGRRGYIQKLVVRKDYRRRGLGKNLMERAIKKLRKIGALYVPVNSENELVQFYEKCGFKKTKQVPMNVSYSTYHE